MQLQVCKIYAWDFFLNANSGHPILSWAGGHTEIIKTICSPEGETRGLFVFLPHQKVRSCMSKFLNYWMKKKQVVL